MNRGFSVTYDVWTADAVEVGSGYTVEDVGLREALSHCYPQENCDRWFREIDGRMNYSTGETEIRSLHPLRTITAASYRRLMRLLRLE